MKSSSGNRSLSHSYHVPGPVKIILFELIFC